MKKIINRIKYGRKISVEFIEFVTKPDFRETAISYYFTTKGIIVKHHEFEYFITYKRFFTPSTDEVQHLSDLRIIVRKFFFNRVEGRTENLKDIIEGDFKKVLNAI